MRSRGTFGAVSARPRASRSRGSRPTAYEALDELLKALKRSSLEESQEPELLALDCWDTFREAVQEAVPKGRAPRRCEAIFELYDVEERLNRLE